MIAERPGDLRRERPTSPESLAQCDLWFPDADIPLGAGQNGRGTTPVITMVSGYSRVLSGLLIPSRCTEDLFAGQWELIRSLGAVPWALVWDGEGAVGRWRGGRQELTPATQAFRGTLGIKVVLCKPGDPEAKGLVERAPRCLETSFLQAVESGGGGSRTPVPRRPFGASPGAAGGWFSPRGSHRRRSLRPARVRCPAAAPGRSRLREPAHDARPRAAGWPGRTATQLLRQRARTQCWRLLWCHLFRDACGDVGPLPPSDTRPSRSRCTPAIRLYGQYRGAVGTAALTDAGRPRARSRAGAPARRSPGASRTAGAPARARARAWPGRG